MSADGDEARLQQMAAQIEELDQILTVLRNQVQRLRDDRRELRETIEAIESLDEGDTVQVPLGGGTFVRAAIEDLDGLIVSVGAGYAAERSEAEAVAVLETRLEQLEAEIEEAEAAIADLEAQGEELGAQAQQEYAELAARQQQAAGDGPTGGPDLGDDA